MRSAPYLFACLALCGCGQSEKVGQLKPAVLHRQHVRSDIVCVNVPAGSALDAMRAFGEQADIMVAYPADGSYSQTRAMKKCGAIESLLKELVADTDLEVAYLQQTKDGFPVFAARHLK